jgi:hypothetical protein
VPGACRHDQTDVDGSHRGLFPKRGVKRAPCPAIRQARTGFLEACHKKGTGSGGALSNIRKVCPRSAKRISKKTPFLTRSQHVELRTGLGPKQLAAEHQFGARQYANQARHEAAAKVRALAADRARQRLAYDNAKTKDIRRFKDLQKRKRLGEMLADDVFDFMMQFAADHANQEHDFLHEPFDSSPPTRRKKYLKRLKPRTSARARIGVRLAGQPLPGGREGHDHER